MISPFEQNGPPSEGLTMEKLLQAKAVMDAAQKTAAPSIYLVHNSPESIALAKAAFGLDDDDFDYHVTQGNIVLTEKLPIIPQ